MATIFDSHAHYDDEAFDADREALLAGFPARGVSGVLNVGTNVRSSRYALELADTYPFVWAAVGIHPSDLAGVTDGDIEVLRKLYAHPKAVAIGEIGLDYHYDTFPREVQKAWFSKQLALATELGAPVIVHNREAHEDALTLLKQYRPQGVVHCFSGSVETAYELCRLGLYIGFGGAVTFKNARKPLEVAAAIPLDRLLLETDAPYMAPVPYRGKRCDSTMIEQVAATIAAVRGITADEVKHCAADNARRAFPKIG